jgi:hypothetical protein
LNFFGLLKKKRSTVLTLHWKKYGRFAKILLLLWTASLKCAAGFIQSQLGTALRIRKIPRLRFHADTSIREGFDLVKKIEELANKEEK